MLTGYKPDAISAFGKNEDGGWKVTIEVIEMSRIPATSDVMATYVTQLDGEGNLLGYQRIRRYHRGQVFEEAA